MKTIKNIIAYIIYYLISYIIPMMIIIGVGVLALLYSVSGYNWNFLEIF